MGVHQTASQSASLSVMRMKVSRSSLRKTKVGLMTNQLWGVKKATRTRTYEGGTDGKEETGRAS